MALARNPAVVDAFSADGHEIASHGWRWISYQQIDEHIEREHMSLAVDTITRLTGRPPDGWYTGRDSPNTRRLVVEHGGFLYDSDYYGEELPFWKTVGGKGHLVVPYTLTNNDGKYAGWMGTSDQWFSFIRDAFDMLYQEGARYPKMMSIGLHPRLIGHPARAAGLERFLDYVQGRGDVWITRRVDIARHWMEIHPFRGRGLNE